MLYVGEESIGETLMKFNIVESIEVDTAKREAELLSVLKKLSEREVLNLIYYTPSTAVPGDEFPFFITKDGRYIDVGKVSEINGSWAEDSVHADLFDILLEYVYDEYIDHGEYDFYTDWLGESEHDAAYSLLEDACEVLQWVRGNFGTSFVEDRLYFVLPTKVSTQQMYAIRNALAEMEIQKDEYQVFFDNGEWSVKYSFDEVSPGDFLNIMMRYYNTGKKPIGESKRRRIKPRLNEEDGRKVFPFPHTEKMDKKLAQLLGWGYELKTVSLQKISDDNDLDDKDKSLSSSRPQMWGTDVNKYAFDGSKIRNWEYGDIMSAEERPDGTIELDNGRHRCKALLNGGYTHIEIPVRKARK